MRRASDWADWLDKHFVTHQVAQHSAAQQVQKPVAAQVTAVELKAASTPAGEATPEAEKTRKHTLAQVDYTPRQITVKGQSENN